MKALILFLSVIVAACGPSADDPKAQPDKATTLVVAKHEDCTIFFTRTLSPGDNITWVRCTKDDATKAHYTRSCGKGCVRRIETTTIQEAAE
jgi:hypothetical protein